MATVVEYLGFGVDAGAVVDNDASSDIGVADKIASKNFPSDSLVEGVDISPFFCPWVVHRRPSSGMVLALVRGQFLQNAATVRLGAELTSRRS